MVRGEIKRENWMAAMESTIARANILILFIRLRLGGMN